MRSVVYAALAVIVLPWAARAQTLSLTEAEALARLSPDSARVRAIQAAVEIARADVLAANRWPNPVFTIDRESVSGITEYLTMVAQPLPITGRRGFETQAAAALVNATTNRSGDAIRRARADLRLAFAQLLVAQTRERELANARARLQELADVLAKREAAGDAAGFDRLRAEHEVFEVDADRAIAAADRARAQGQVASFFATAADVTRVVAVESAAAPAPLPAIEALVERAESTRGELLALRNEVDAARFSTRAADRRRLPEPEIVAGTKSSNIGDGDIGSVVTILASVPIFDRGQPERALALARLNQAEARMNAFRQTVRAEIAALRAIAQERREASEHYRLAAVSSVGQIERIAQVSYDAGERGILELLDAYQLAASSRVRQAALDLSVKEAEIELEFASGWEIR
jgi:cobalt-zinc-cadmium efflux system outer membrane protein